MAMQDALALKTRPLLPGFGVEILDIDIATADRETIDAVIDTFHRNGAIVLRNQNLSPAQQVAFTREFGEPEGNVREEFTHPDFPEIMIISNKIVDGKPIGNPEAGLNWHTDFQYGVRTALCTLLYSIETPAVGSDTLLADLCTAWNALPEEKQKQIDGLKTHFSYQLFQEKRGVALTQEQKDAMPDVLHPLVRRHPTDGRKAIWGLAVGPVKRLVGKGGEEMDEEESITLIKELIAFCTQEKFVYAHKWQPGDLLVWDNRCTLHTGTRFDFDKYIRHVHRTWVRGDVPF
jgi:taurine dioxygenase